jgi:hypothetical protein
MLENEVMPWKPFGLTLTYDEFSDLVAWYIEKQTVETLDTMEGNDYAI